MYSDSCFSFIEDASVQFFGIGGTEYEGATFRLFEPKKPSIVLPMYGNASNSFNYIFQKHYSKGGNIIDYVVVSSRFAVYLFFSRVITKATMRFAQYQKNGPGDREAVILIVKTCYEYVIVYVVDEIDMPGHDVELYDIEGKRQDWSAAL